MTMSWWNNQQQANLNLLYYYLFGAKMTIAQIISLLVFKRVYDPLNFSNQ